MEAKQKAVNSLGTSEARINIGSTIGTNSVTKIIVVQLLMNDEQLYQRLSMGQISSHLELVLNRYYAKSDEQLEKLGRFVACEYRNAIMTTKSYLINVDRRKHYTLSSYRAYMLNVLSYWEYIFDINFYIKNI